MRFFRFHLIKAGEFKAWITEIGEGGCSRNTLKPLINEYLQVSYISFGLGLDGRNGNFVGILGTVLRPVTWKIWKDIQLLLMEEILHHLTCMKPCK